MLKLLRMTHQREVILHELRLCSHHPTADDLYDRVKTRLPRISLATVYRNLEILSQAGLIKKLTIDGRQKRFDWDPTPHNHIFCMNCQRVDDITCEVPEPLVAVPEQTTGYCILGCRINFFGLCMHCQEYISNKEKGE
jgi:Fe2+ or Zn2+ uptake regulation protein